MPRTALVTGSSRGMGRAEILEFAKKGYNCIIHYVHNKAEADEVVAECDKLGAKAVEIQANLEVEEDIERLAKEALAAFGTVDILVNNAGYAIYTPIAEKDEKSFDAMMKIHVYAPFMLTKLLAPEMVKNNFGRIVNIGTIDIMKTYNPESTEYDAAKSAVISLTKNMSLAYQPVVNVNCVCPGWIWTDMTKQNPPELNKTITSKIAKGRFAQPEEIAKVVSFLCSDDAEYIDGAVIIVDGGFKLM